MPVPPVPELDEEEQRQLQVREQNKEVFKYPEWAKMPADYDFSTKGSLSL